MHELIINIDRLHTTPMGADRIRKNLELSTDDPVQWCAGKITDEKATIERKGKNWYVSVDDCVITVNAHSFTVITAHRNR